MVAPLAFFAFFCSACAVQAPSMTTITATRWVKGHVVCPTGWVPYNAEVKIFEVDPLFGGGYDFTLLETATVDSDGNFDVSFAWPPPPGALEFDGPDLVFQVSQNIEGTMVTVYDEMPDEELWHWNVHDMALSLSTGRLEFNITTPLAVCWNPDVDPTNLEDDRPTVKLFLFTRVENTG